MKEKKEASPNLRLKYERKLRGWSQEKLAEEIGTTWTSISRWENGSKSPSPYFCEKLCQLFGKNAEELGLLPQNNPPAAEPAYHEALSHQASIASRPIRLSSNPVTPPPLTVAQGLIGRDELLRTLKQRLSGCETPVLAAIHGLPGVGKTALAVTVAHDKELLEHFHNEVLWVSLGPQPDVLGLLSRWGVHLGVASTEVSDPTSIETWTKAIFTVIGKRQMLLIIDDVWDIRDALAFKVGGYQCAYLLTTRFPEIARRFAHDGAIQVHELMEEDGLALLRRLAPEAVSNELSGAHRLVQSVGGLPLALTIIGNYLHVQFHSGQPRRLHKALQQLEVIEERLRLSLPREPLEPSSLSYGTPLSLQAIIEISDRHLSEKASLALRLLSIFPAKPNTFSEEAALAYCAMTPETLDALTDVGLLEGGGLGRYTLHQTVADYMGLRIESVSVKDQHDAIVRLVRFFVAYVQQHQAEYELLDLELNNIQVTLRVAYNKGMSAEFVQGATAFAPFLIARSLYDVAEIQLIRAQEIAQSSDNKTDLTYTWFYLGRIAEERGDLVQSAQRYQEGLTLARSIYHQELMCDLLTHHGKVMVDQGDLVSAKESLEEALDLARRIGLAQRICVILRILGEVSDSGGDYASGNASYQEGLVLARQIGDWETASALLQNLGVKAEWHGDYTHAEEYYREALALAQQMNHRQRICGVLMNMGVLAFRRKQYTEAEKLYLESLKVARAIGSRRRISGLLQNLGMLATERGDYTTAKEYLEESLELAYATADHWLINETLNEMGELSLKQQDVENASLYLHKALLMAQERGASPLVAFAFFGLARLAAFQGNRNEAKHLGDESLAIFTELQHEKKNQVMQWLQELC